MTVGSPLSSRADVSRLGKVIIRDALRVFDKARRDAFTRGLGSGTVIP